MCGWVQICPTITGRRFPPSIPFLKKGFVSLYRLVSPQSLHPLHTDTCTRTHLLVHWTDGRGNHGNCFSERGEGGGGGRAYPCAHTFLLTRSGRSHRFGPYFREPVVADLDPKTNEPYIASMDLVGCPIAHHTHTHTHTPTHTHALSHPLSFPLARSLID